MKIEYAWFIMHRQTAAAAVVVVVVVRGLK